MINYPTSHYLIKQILFHSPPEFQTCTSDARPGTPMPCSLGGVAHDQNSLPNFFWIKYKSNF